MPRQQRFLQLPLMGKVFLAVLAAVYLVYMVGFVQYLAHSVFAPASTVVEHTVESSPTVSLNHWNTSTMQTATPIDDELLESQDAPMTQATTDVDVSKSGKQKGQAPSGGNTAYPISTVGKIFFSDASGRNYVCSGTAIISRNNNTVDTAGHCLYWSGEWVENVIFCPQYDQGNTPYSCWAARALEVPADWINARQNDLHHDFGMAIMAPNSQGNLTDLVGGAGWAYNQSATQTFYAYGYPAGYPFDGQSRKSCQGNGKSWQYAGGKVVSIPCDMTGGSSGGPWFVKIGGEWYLNGHNDFTSTIQPDHMFSPFYDDTWYELYNKAQSA